MRKFGIVFGLLVAVLAISLGATLIPQFKEKASSQQQPEHTQSVVQQAEDYQAAVELVENGKPEEALDIIHKYKREIETHSENGMKWMELFILASEENRDIPQLVVLFEYFPEIFKEHESASLLVADSYIANNRLKDYKKVRSLWKDRETKIASWYVLDVDQLLLDGRRKEAIELLKSRTFKDKADVGRLVRLSLLYADEDPKTAWRYLGEAYAKDPQNAEVRLYRAKLLETGNKFHLANKEYQAAVRLNPNNIFLKDQLANFYLRQREYPLALKVMSENLAPPSLDNLWVKALFWNKVTTPLRFDWNETPPPQGKLDPLIQYLTNLDNNTFWNEEKFERIPNNAFYLKNQQETFWLKLLNSLKSQDEKVAYKLLNYNPFMATSWYPELETALKQTLNYRSHQTLAVTPSVRPAVHTPIEKQDHLQSPPFFKELQELATNEQNDKNNTYIPDEIHNLLVSNEVFSALFLAAGWNEAGLQLHQLPIIPNDFPNWVSVNITNAIHQNRSILEALEFASLQKQTPELTLLTAELMIAGGDSNAALDKLNELSQADSEIGFRSAWLASLIYIEQKDWKNARNTVIAQPRLVNDLLGKETLARIAYLEGNLTLANKLFAALEKSSPEARSYLARKAFEEKDWTRAQELTEQLIQDYPDNPLLKQNLNKILEEQRNEEHYN